MSIEDDRDHAGRPSCSPHLWSSDRIGTNATVYNRAYRGKDLLLQSVNSWLIECIRSYITRPIKTGNAA